VVDRVGTVELPRPGNVCVAPVDEAPRAFDPKPLVVFFLLAYVLSWSWVIPIAITGHTVREGKGWPTHFPALIGPMLAAFAVTAWTTGGPGVRDLCDRMRRWRIGWRWWLVTVSPLAFVGIAIGVVAVTGGTLPPATEFARISGLPAGLGILGVALTIVAVDGFGEETGWRGYALPQLQQRFTPLTATAIIAGCWAAWHIPEFFLLDSYKGFSAARGIGFVFGLTCGAVVATWLYNRAGASILAVAVWHGIFNVAAGTKAATAGSGTIAAVVSTLIMVQAFVLVGLELRARHYGKPSILGPAT
jgi:uncharacterized protein